MKYILMMNTMRANAGGFPEWSPKAIQAHIAFMKKLNKDLRASGELVSAEGLTFLDRAKLIKANHDGTPITDGVFPEGKEFLAAFWIIDVDTPEDAYQIAARASAAPGHDGSPMNMFIEVRPVMSAPPDEFV